MFTKTQKIKYFSLLRISLKTETDLIKRIFHFHD